MPNSLMSSTYRPLPVMKRLSSLRTTLAPMPSTPMSRSPYRSCWVRHFHRNRRPEMILRSKRLFEASGLRLFGSLRDLHAARGVEHRLDDIVIAGAAADVAFELVPDGCLVEIAAIAVHDIDR